MRADVNPNENRAYNSWHVIGRLSEEPLKEATGNGDVMATIKAVTAYVNRITLKIVCFGEMADIVPTLYEKGDLLNMYGMFAQDRLGDTRLVLLECSLIEKGGLNLDPETEYRKVLGLYSPEAIDSRFDKRGH